MLKDLNTCFIDMNNGNQYWGEAINTYANYYNPVGTGIHVKPDTSFYVTERHIDNAFYDGIFLHRGTDSKARGLIGNCRNKRLYGPRLDFVYEKYIILACFNSNSELEGFYCHVNYDGSYTITRYENGVCCGRGIYCKDGVMQFITLDSKGSVQRYLSNCESGSELIFTTSRMFFMPFERDKNIITHKASDNYGFVRKVQAIGNEPNGYGICRWDNGDSYFGEYQAGSRSGLGSYTFANGDTLLGKFYRNEMYGNGVEWFSNGALSFGNFKNDLREGLFFDMYVFGTEIVISHFEEDRQVGRSLHFDKDFNLTVYPNGSNNGFKTYFG